MLRMGLMPRWTHTYLLSVPRRKTGRIQSTPVTLVERDGGRWLVAPYGERDWVRNARAAGRVTLSRGRHRETVAIEVVGPQESAPILRQYMKQTRITGRFFDVSLDSPLEAFVQEAPRHPVFRIVGPAP